MKNCNRSSPRARSPSSRTSPASRSSSMAASTSARPRRPTRGSMTWSSSFAPRVTRSSPGGRSGWPASGSTARAKSTLRFRASMPRCRRDPSGPSPPTRRSRQLGIGLSQSRFGQGQQRRSRRGDVSLGRDQAEREARPVSGARRRGRLYRPQPVQGNRRPAGERPHRPLYRRHLLVSRRPGSSARTRARSK